MASISNFFSKQNQFNPKLTNFLYIIWQARTDVRSSPWGINGVKSFLWWWILYGHKDYKISLTKSFPLNLWQDFATPISDEVLHLKTVSLQIPQYFKCLIDIRRHETEYVRPNIPERNEFLIGNILVTFFASSNLKILDSFQNEFHDYLKAQSDEVFFLTNAQYLIAKNLNRLHEIRNKSDFLKILKDFNPAFESFPFYGFSKIVADEIEEDQFKETYDSRENGVNLIGYFKSYKGIAEDVRQLFSALVKEGWQINMVDLDSAEEIDFHAMSTVHYGTNIFCLPAYDICFACMRLPTSYLEGKCNIALMPWELPYWPKEMKFLLEALDGIGVYTDFVKKSIPEEFISKVEKFPMLVEVQSPPKNDISFLNKYNLKDDIFYFLLTFDSASYSQRKNPEAVLRAFEAAFKPEEKVGLIIKVSYLETSLKERLDHFVKRYPQIVVVDEILEKAQLISLYARSDAFISLHRSEGFGRIIAEQMLLKKPVIVTAFSGNMDFNRPDNSFLVKYEQVPLELNDYVFADSHQYWAEPDISDAACKLRKVFQSRYEGSFEEVLQSAKRTIEENYSLNNQSSTISNKLTKMINNYRKART